MTLRSRLARLEVGRSKRVVVITVPDGGTAEQVAEANGFALQPSDLVVAINKPGGCAAGTVRLCGDAA